MGIVRRTGRMEGPFYQLLELREQLSSLGLYLVGGLRILRDLRRPLPRFGVLSLPVEGERAGEALDRGRGLGSAEVDVAPGPGVLDGGRGLRPGEGAAEEDASHPDGGESEDEEEELDAKGPGLLLRGDSGQDLRLDLRPRRLALTSFLEEGVVVLGEVD